MDLDKVKLKTSDELLPDEKQFLVDNRAKLNDEDLAAYADFINPDPETVTPPTGGEGSSAAGSQGDGGDGGNGAAGGDDKSQPNYSFKTEEEARAFVEKTLSEREAQRKTEDDTAKQKAIDAAKTPEEKKWVDDNWKPKDWNEGIQTTAEATIKIIEERQAAAAQKVQENAQRLEKEWQDIAKTNNLPALDTDEGKKVHNQIVQVALTHGKTNFKDAHALWSIIPEDKGGGYKIPASEAASALAKSKATLNAQKAAAGSVGGKTPDTKVQGVQHTSKDLREKSLDTLIDERLNM